MSHAAGTSAAAADTTLPVCLSMHIAITHHSYHSCPLVVSWDARTHARTDMSCLVSYRIVSPRLVLWDNVCLFGLKKRLAVGILVAGGSSAHCPARPRRAGALLACNSPQTHCPFRSTCCCGRNDTLCQDRLRANQQKVEKNGPFRSCCTTRSWCAPIGRF
jgi:hypothetical protein